MRINRIALNVRGQTKEIEVGACHAIVGPPRSGKTPYLDAIQLALTGTHAVGGRNKDLAELVSPDARELFALVTCADDSSAMFRATKKGATLAEPEHTISGALASLSPSDRHTILTPGVKLWTSGTYLRELVISRFGAPVSSANAPPEACSPNQAALWRRLLGSSGAAESVLADLVKTARNEGRAQARACTIARESLQATEDRLQAATGSEVLGDLRARRDTLLTTLAQPDGTLELAVAKRELENAELSLSRFQNRPEIPSFDVEKTQQMAAKLRAEVLDLDRRVAFGSAAEGVLRLLAAGSPASCPLCGSSGKLDAATIQERLTTITQRREQRTKAQRDLALAHEGLARHHGLVQAAQQWEVSRGAVQQQVGQARVALAHVQAKANAAPVDRTAVQDQIKDINAKIQRLESIEADRRALDYQRKQIEAHEAERADYSVIEKCAATRLGSLWHSAKAACEGTIQRYATGSVRVVISDDHDWCVIGADGREHPLVCASGTEQAIARIAITLAFGPSIVLLDDADFAGLAQDSVRELLAGLRECVQCGELDQVIVARNRPEDVPDGYSITDTSPNASNATRKSSASTDAVFALL